MKKKFAVIGKPVAHSLSPLLHNYWFDKYKIEAEYSMLEIDEADIESILAKVKSREISGIAWCWQKNCECNFKHIV